MPKLIAVELPSSIFELRQGALLSTAVVLKEDGSYLDLWEDKPVVYAETDSVGKDNQIFFALVMFYLLGLRQKYMFLRSGKGTKLGIEAPYNRARLEGMGE